MIPSKEQIEIINLQTSEMQGVLSNKKKKCFLNEENPKNFSDSSKTLNDVIDLTIKFP